MQGCKVKCIGQRERSFPRSTAAITRCPVVTQTTTIEQTEPAEPVEQEVVEQAVGQPIEQPVEEEPVQETVEANNEE